MSQPPRPPTAVETDRYANALHTTALVALFVCPALALLPPRKLDFYTVGLIGGTAYSANLLVGERTGRSIWQNISSRRRREEPVVHQYASLPATGEQANLNRGLRSASSEVKRIHESGSSVTDEIASRREAWKLQREKEIKDDLDEGKGLSDMIFDQIWEVWNWGKPKEDEDDG